MADATTAWEAYEQCKAIVEKLSCEDRQWVTEALYGNYNPLMTLEDDEKFTPWHTKENLMFPQDAMRLKQHGETCTERVVTAAEFRKAAADAGWDKEQTERAMKISKIMGSRVCVGNELLYVRE